MQSLPTAMQRIVVRRTPTGIPVDEDFAREARPLPPLNDGEVLVRNSYLSIDPSTRIRLRGEESDYMTPLLPGDPIDGFAVGYVAVSRDPAIVEGTAVRHYGGWSDWAVVRVGTGWRDAQSVPVSNSRHLYDYLGALGPSGLTAWGGLLKVGLAQSRDCLYVSAATGAVGLIVVELGRRHCGRVVASAGSDEKVAQLIAMGVDGAFNHRTEGVERGLARVAPTGLDLYFDNVGGEHLSSALRSMNAGGRVVLCGMVSRYNESTLSVPDLDLSPAIFKGVRLEGFLARNLAPHEAEFRAEVGGLMDTGALQPQYTMVEGLDSAPAALARLLLGETRGKTLVAL